MSLRSPTSYPLDLSASPSPPLTRGSSPSPSLSPSTAMNLSCPPLDRCFSTSSTLSTISGRSSSSRTSSSSAVSRRRGYVRTQGIDFADSARARDSVLSLGSIAHLQYYFARTGILDGKGGRMAQEKKNLAGDAAGVAILGDEANRPDRYGAVEGLRKSSIEEEGDEDGQDWESHEGVMLPPTVSTYSHNARYIPPPPDVETLRRELRESLVHVTKAMGDARCSLAEDMERMSLARSDEVIGKGKEHKEVDKSKEEFQENTELQSDEGFSNEERSREMEEERNVEEKLDEKAEQKAGEKIAENKDPAAMDEEKPAGEKADWRIPTELDCHPTAERSEDICGEKTNIPGKPSQNESHQDSGHLDSGPDSGQDSRHQDSEEQEHETSVPSPSRGWHRIQGMHILDVVTLAIRAAKIYYTTHEQPQRLYQIKSERQIREELLGVLDVLKRLALRNFAGGIKADETSVMEAWVYSVDHLLARELALEVQEKQDRISWTWLAGNWDGDLERRRREWLFLHTFLEPGQPELPPWTLPSALADATELATPFLRELASGLILVRLHNRILATSIRRLGAITRFHTDTAKPYRAADNLRFWIKAAEIRWETRLRVDVMGVVCGGGDYSSAASAITPAAPATATPAPATSPALATASTLATSPASGSSNAEAWMGFDAALLQWCRAVREEITREWRTGAVQVSLPVLVD